MFCGYFSQVQFVQSYTKHAGQYCTCLQYLFVFIIRIPTINTDDLTPLLYYQICPDRFHYKQNAQRHNIYLL